VVLVLLCLARGARGTEPSPCVGKYEGDACALAESDGVCCKFLDDGVTYYCSDADCEMRRDLVGQCNFHPARGELMCWEEHWSTGYHACIDRMGLPCMFGMWLRVGSGWHFENVTGTCQIHPLHDEPYCIYPGGSSEAGVNQCENLQEGDTCGTPTAAQPTKVCNYPWAGGFLACGSEFSEQDAAKVCDGKNAGASCSFVRAGGSYGEGGTVNGVCHFARYTQDYLCVEPQYLPPESRAFSPSAIIGTGGALVASFLTFAF